MDLIASQPPRRHAELLAAALGAIVFSISLFGTYVYDDLEVVIGDPRIRSISAWREALTGPYAGGVDNLYRPLVTLTYAVQWQIHGDFPAGFHAVNVLLHAINCGLVVMLARRVLKPESDLIPLLAGLMFAVHPIHTEAVANIVGRAELMCTLGTIGAILLLLASPLTPRRAVGVLGCFLVALLSKEQGMLVPIVLVLAGWMLRTFTAAERSGIRTLLILICFSMAGYIVLRENVLGLKFWWSRQMLDWHHNPLVRPDADPLLVPLLLLGRYTQLLLVPWKLSADYGGRVIGWQVSFADPYFWIGLAALLTWITLSAVALVRRQWPTLFLLLSLAIFYALIANVLTIIGTIFGERLMYLPSVFFLILLAIPLARLPRRALVPLMGIALALAFVRSFTYASVWNDPIGFYQYTLDHQPLSGQAHRMVSANRLERGDVQGALDVALRFNAIYPDHYESWLYVARALMRQGHFDTAEKWIERSKQIQITGATTAVIRELAELRAAAATQPATRATPAPLPPTTRPVPESRPPTP